jgi:sugar-specific transcriptional regulator TrmB
MLTNHTRRATEIVRVMQELGFSQYEGHVYVALLQKSPATAYEVSKQAGLPHANVYRTLEGLQTKGVVQSISEKPVKYVPARPKEVLQTITRRTAAACERLEKQLSSLDKAEDIEPVCLVPWGQSTHEKIEEMLKTAKEQVWIKSRQSTLDQHFDSLKAAANRGLKILIIFIGDPEAVQRYAFTPKTKVYCHEGTGRSGIGEGRETLTVTSDFSSALTVDTREGGYAAFTRSGPVVNLASTMIRHELYVAEIFQKFGKQIEGEFGPALLELRRHYMPAEHIRALEEQIRLSEAKNTSMQDERAQKRRRHLVAGRRST